MRPEEVVGKVFGVHPAQVSDETSNQNLSAWDSLAHMNLVLELESVYGISLSTEDAMAMTDVAAVKQALQRHGVAW